MTRTANIATYPARAKSLRAMLETIKGQFDVVRICLNEYDSIPEDLAGYQCIIPEANKKDIGKFLWLNEATIHELYFTLDDDLIYPPDYADRMQAHLLYADVVSAHGHTIKSIGDDWHDGHSVHTFSSSQNQMRYVHVGGSGCMAIKGGALTIDMGNWQPGFADADLALECAEQNNAILLVPHHGNWITEQPKIKGTPLSRSTRQHPRLSDISDRVHTVWQHGFPIVQQKVCFTIVTNGYDLLRQPEYITPGWEYQVITDAVANLADAGTGIWQPLAIEGIIGENHIYTDKQFPQSEQRVAKAFPLFQNTRSVYVDSNMVVIGDLDVLVMEAQHRSGLITSVKHRGRDCVFEEAEAILEFKKDTPLRVLAWTECLKLLGRKTKAGLSETGILIRDHSSNEREAVNMAQRLWLMLMNTYSWRDQLTFDIVAELFGVSNRILEETFNRFIKWTPHSSARLVIEAEADTDIPETEEVTEIPKTKVTVETILADDNAAPPKKLSLGIVTSSTSETMPLIPLFVMAALEHNPDAYVTVLVPPSVEVADMEPVVNRHGVLNYLVAPASVMDGVMADPTVAQYLYQPPSHTDLLFCCPISHMILSDLRATYLPIMEKSGAAYVNAMDQFETRLTPLHFTRWEAMHPHPMVAQQGHDLFKPLGFTLGRIVCIVTQRPLVFNEFPATGFDIFSKIGLPDAWNKFTTTEPFAEAMKDLSEEGEEWLKMLGK